jgi:hypothetical protein
MERVSRRRAVIAIVGAISGAAATIFGIWLIYPPAGIITGGLLVGVVSFFGFRIDEEGDK